MNTLSRGLTEKTSVCPKISCKPYRAENYSQITCPKLICPEGFKPKYDDSNSMQKFSFCDNACVPVLPKERICEIFGRTITTFDNLVYKYDLCNHVLVRSQNHSQWYIAGKSIYQQCKYYIFG